MNCAFPATANGFFGVPLSRGYVRPRKFYSALSESLVALEKDVTHFFNNAARLVSGINNTLDKVLKIKDYIPTPHWFGVMKNIFMRRNPTISAPVAKAASAPKASGGGAAKFASNVVGSIGAFFRSCGEICSGASIKSASGVVLSHASLHVSRGIKWDELDYA